MGAPKVLIALGVIALIAVTPAGRWLESSMVAHVLVEFPLLVLAGVIIGSTLLPRMERFWIPWNGGGIAGLLVASFTLAFWMIPRWLDASLNDPWIAVAKYGSLPLMVGVPLACSWYRMHAITRAVVKIEFLTMLLRLGWLYLISPDRLCNNYLLNEQVWLGQGFLLLAIALAITWLIPVFFGPLDRLEQQWTAHRAS